ncbi:MAG: hypothetical protein ABSB67_03330 [Bryobacteraceae bacterium]
MQAQTVLIILREALRLENPVVAGFRQALECVARKPRADAIRWQKAAQDLPRRNVPSLIFGKFVAINAVNNFTGRRWQRQHRRLHHAEFPAIAIDAAERVGMNQVLGIVRHHDFEAHLVMFLEQQHALENPVQAVGFGGGAVVRANRKVNVTEPLLESANGFERRVVVGICADEEIVVAVANGRDVVPHHAANDAGLLPERNENRDPLFASGGARECFGSLATPLPPRPDDGRIDHKIVQSVEKNEQRDGQQSDSNSPVQRCADVTQRTQHERNVHKTLV